MILGELAKRIVPERLVVGAIVRGYVRSIGGGNDGIESNPFSGTISREMSREGALRMVAESPDYSGLTQNFLDDLRADRDQRKGVNIAKYNVDAIRELDRNIYSTYSPELRVAIAGGASSLLAEAFGGIRDDRIDEVLARMDGSKRQEPGLNRRTMLSGYSTRQLLDSLLSNPPTIQAA